MINYSYTSIKSILTSIMRPYYLYFFDLIIHLLQQDCKKIINKQFIACIQMTDHQAGMQHHQNQFDDISAMMNEQLITNFHLNHDISGYSQYDEGTQFLQKLNYYKKLTIQNKQLYQQLKQFDAKLNTQLKSIQHKKPNSTAKLKPRIKSQRNENIQNKYKQLDLYKMQLQQKMLQKSSLEQLIAKLEQKKAIHRQKYIEVELKVKKLKKLEQILQAKQKQDVKVLSNSILVSDGYQQQIKQLKKIIKDKNEVIYEKKNKFIEQYKNRNKNNSTLQLSNVKDQGIQEVFSPQLQALKNKYQNLGKKIQKLKSHKNMLIDGKSSLEERKKYLDKLKLKLKQLNKI